MSKQTATLRELVIAEDAAKFSSNTALEFDVSGEIAFVHVGPRAAWALPVSTGASHLPANRSTMPIQSEYVGVTLPAIVAHEWLVGFRCPSRINWIPSLHIFVHRTLGIERERTSGVCNLRE